ncbi:MAG: ComEC/Rec2 family competence protein [Chloroflexi bacterium]|nr:ComEC/Rec2 family competence protein [Chloroflexota bacterium]
MRLIYLSAALLGGVYLGSLTAPSPPLILVTAAGALAVALLPHDWRKSLLVMLCLVALLLGIFRYQSTRFVADESSISTHNGRDAAEVKGVVADDPEIRDAAVNLRLSAAEGRFTDGWMPVSGVILVSVRLLPVYHYGDVLKVTGALEAPPKFSDFDYREYLARQGIRSVMRYPRVQLLESGQGFKLLEWIYGLRRSLADSLSAALPEPQAALAQGIILGIRAGIPDDLNEAFSRSGTMHIIAISGQNISLIAGLFLVFAVALFGRHRPFYFIFVLAMVWLYALLTGMAPPVQRAAVMGSLWLTADFIGRPRSAAPALGFAAAAMVGINPDLLWDVSFQLSFASMAGLAVITPAVQEVVAKWQGNPDATEVRGPLSVVVDSLAVTLGATLATLPIIAVAFHRLPLAVLPSNVAALPALPFIMATSGLASTMGAIFPPLGELAGWVAWPFLTYLMVVATSFSALPIASAEVGGGAHWGFLYYLLLGAALWGIPQWSGLKASASGSGGAAARAIRSAGSSVRRLGAARVAFVALAAACLAVWLAVVFAREDGLRVSFLDVGQGDAALIQTPSGRRVLIDGGPSPRAIGAQLGKKLPFWDNSIDLVVLTHPDDDHANGLTEVLRRYRVRQAMDPGIKHASPVYREWQRLVRDKKVGIVIATAGQRVDLGDGLTMEVAHPQAQLISTESADANNNSIVLRLTSADMSFLFTGDLEEEGQRYLLSKASNLDSTVLKVPHHGAKKGLAPEFLEAVNPQIAVISVGAANTFGHPARETLEKLNAKIPADRVYLTERQGTVDITVKEGRVWVKTER